MGVLKGKTEDSSKLDDRCGVSQRKRTNGEEMLETRVEAE